MSFVFLILFFLLASLAYACVRGAPWVPTWRRDIARLMLLLNLKSGQKLYELGCGDGRVGLALVRGTGAELVGIELSFLHWAIAQVLKRLKRMQNARFVWGDIYRQDLSDADAVYLFLMPEFYEKLKPKLERELRPGTRVVSYVWPIEGWAPIAVDQPNKDLPAMYAYEISNAPFCSNSQPSI